MAVFGLCAVAGYFAPRPTLVTTWVALIAIHLRWRRAVARATDVGAHSFDYRFWPRYGGWVVFSGIFLVILPVVQAISPNQVTWADFARQLPEKPPLELSAWVAILLPFATAWIGIPVLGLAAFLTAPAIALTPTGLRLIPIPFLRVRDVSWTDIERFAGASFPRPKPGQVVNYRVYLDDGSYFVILTKGLRESADPLIEAIASHVPLERG